MEVDSSLFTFLICANIFLTFVLALFTFYFFWYIRKLNFLDRKISDDMNSDERSPLIVSHDVDAIVLDNQEVQPKDTAVLKKKRGASSGILGTRTSGDGKYPNIKRNEGYQYFLKVSDGIAHGTTSSSSTTSSSCSQIEHMTLRANTNSSSGLSDEFEDMHILKQSAVTKGIETALIEGWTWGKGEDEGGEDKALALSCSSLQRRYSARAETLKNIRRLRMVDVTVQQLIGTGHSGKVYRGTLYDSSTFSPDTVAIKQLKVGEDKAESRVHFLQEATFMAQMDHKNVVNFIGVVAETVPWMIVTEFMANGSVKDYLTRNGSQILTVDRVRMGRDIAFGMEHIGKHHFVHRDLALRNCLLDAYLNVKISDFGLTRALSQGKGKHQDEEYYCNTTTRHSPFPIRWTAPEVLSSGKFTSHSDMWSYGITLWELFSDGQTPYADKHGKWELLKVAIKVSKGYRLDRPAKCPKPIYVMMLNLWCDNPRCRPHSSEVGKMMDRWYQLHSMRSQSSDADLTHQGPRLRKHVSRGSIPNLEVSIGELGSEEMGEKELSLDLCGSSAHEKNEEDTNTPEKVDTLQHDLEPKIQRSSFGRQESVGKLEN